MSDEQEWLRQLKRDNEAFERMRNQQPGKARPTKQAESDWFVLGIVLLVLIAGFFS